MSEQLNELGSALGLVERLSKDSVRTTILAAPEEPKGSYYLVDEKGVATKTMADAAWHTQSMITPANLAKFIADRKKDRSAVFLNEAQALFVYDLEDRRNWAVCNLVQSEVYQWLLTKSKNPMNQTDFVRLLRITLRGCLPQDTNLLGLIRNLKFAMSSDGGSAIEHGKDRMGKSVSASVSAEFQIPEEITLGVQVFDNFPSYRAAIPCAIEIFTTDQSFKLTPFPMALNLAMANTLDVVEEVFGDGGMPPIYRGRP